MYDPVTTINIYSFFLGLTYFAKKHNMKKWRDPVKELRHLLCYQALKSITEKIFSYISQSERITFTRITNGERICRNILYNDASGTDHTVVANCHPGSTTTFPPIHTLLPTVIGLAYSRPLFRCSTSRGWPAV